ncbi:MAG TPA: hypothetical protein VH702_02840 [Vicinamibacterales bacterium]
MTLDRSFGGLGYALRRALHVRAALEFDSILRSDAHQTRTEADGGQLSRVYLFVNLLATDEPIFRKFSNGDIRLGMRREVSNAHN